MCKIGVYCQALVPLVPKPPRPNTNPVQPSSKPKLTQRGLGLTLKFCRPPTTHHRPITFKNEGGVPQKRSEKKNGPEWSTLLILKKYFQVDSERKDIE